jgi:hypothetical protein
MIQDLLSSIAVGCVMWFLVRRRSKDTAFKSLSAIAAIGGGILFFVVQRLK